SRQFVTRASRWRVRTSSESSIREPTAFNCLASSPAIGTATNSPDSYGAGLRADRPLRILQTSTSDVAGGAEKVAANLFQTYRSLGHESWLAVGLRRSQADDVFVVPNDASRSWWTRMCTGAGETLEHFGSNRVTRRVRHALTYEVGQRARWQAYRQGLEDFDFPAT